jgi:hypothetical protein
MPGLTFLLMIASWIRIEPGSGSHERSKVMKKIYALGLAAILAGAIASPAAAQSPFAAAARGLQHWDNLGTVDFGRRAEVERVFGTFGGPAERLRLTADRNGVQCRSIDVTFANGRTRTVFTGILREDRPTIVDLPGNERNLRNVTFHCRSLGRATALVSIAGGIDARDRRAWRDNPLFNARPGFSRDIVMTIGTETFGTRNQRETITTRFSGQRVQAIGLKAINGTATCRRLVAQFANGTRQVLAAPNMPNTLRPGRTVWFDLPGNARNVQSIVMACEAEGRTRNVTIEVLAERDTPALASGYGRR